MADRLHMNTTERIALAVETARQRGWGDTCLTCRFFSHSDSYSIEPEEPEAHFGRCMRFPPTPGVRREENSFGWTVDGIYGRPEVDGTDWCGEHQTGDNRNPKATDLAPVNDTFQRRLWERGWDAGEAQERRIWEEAVKLSLGTIPEGLRNALEQVRAGVEGK